MNIWEPVLCGAVFYGSFAPGAAANLWPDDGSFETGHTLFVQKAEKGNAYDGEYALLIPAGETSVTGGLAVAVLQAGPTYVFSAWLKSPVDVTVDALLSTERYQPTAQGSLQLKAGVWKQLVFHIDATPGVSIRFEISKPANAPLWIDAIKLALRDEPESARYTPSAPISAGVMRADSIGEVCFRSEAPATRLFRIRNNSNAAQNVHGTVTLEAPELPPRKLWEGSAELAPGKAFEKQLELLPETVPGYWVVRTRVSDAAGREYETAMPFAVVAPPRASDDPFMGLHVWRIPIERYRHIGVKAARNIIRWQPALFKDGHYLQTATENGFQQQLSMDVALPHGAAAKNPDGSGAADALELYLSDYFRNRPATVRWIDMENEPDLGWRFRKTLPENAEHYADYFHHFAAIVRKVMPHAKVGAAGTSGDDFNSHFPFLQRVAERAGGEIDFFPIHPYAHARYIDQNHTDIGPEINGTWTKTQEARELVDRAGKEKELLFGEVGWALDVRTDWLDDAALRHSQYLARLFLMARALKISSLQWFLGDDHIERTYYYYGLWRNSLPLASVAAYAATAQRLDGAEIVSVLENDAVYLYLFRDADNRLFAAGWTTDELPVKVRLNFAPGSVEQSNWVGRKLDSPGPEFELTQSPRYWIALPGREKEFRRALENRVIDRVPLEISRRLVSRKCVAFEFVNRGTKAFDGNVEFNGKSRKLKLEAPEATGWKINPTRQTVEFSVGDAGSAATLHLSDADGRKYFMNFRTEKLLPLKGELPVMASRDYVLPNDPNIGWEGPDDLSVKSRFSWTKENLICHLTVTDDVHDPVNRNFWAGDSLQLAIDTGCNGTTGYDNDDFEFTIAHIGDKTGVECSWLPVSFSREELVAAVRAESSRKGNKTCYHVEIPWRALRFNPEPGRVIGINFIINDSDADGRGRAYWMGLTPGIGEGKTPGVFRKFVLE